MAEILALPELRRGRPTIEAARHAIDRSVRWVHVAEVADIAHLLHGGELILSTGVALPSAAEALVGYISDLAAAQATGVIIELGRRFTDLPAAIVQSAEAHSLPVIALHTEVSFVAITEAVHSMIVNAQVRQLQLGEVVHRAFRSLAAEASTPKDIVDQVAQLADGPVVFENVGRHVLAFACATASAAQVLDHWETRSRQAGWSNHTAVLGTERWLTTPVGARGQVWGRLILLPALTTTPLQTTILEQGATSLALHLLIEREERHLEHQTHGTLITDIIDHRYSSADEIHSRTEALGVVTQRRLLVALIVRSEQGGPLSDIARHARAREEVTAISRALTDVAATGLVGLLEPGRLGVLVSTPPNGLTKNTLEAIARAIHERTGKLAWPGSTVIGVGSPVGTIDGLRRSFAEANEAAEAARSLPVDRLFVTTGDIRLRGLIHLLCEDSRVQSYAERELGPLVSYDERHHTQLVATLAAYLEAGGNKSAAADGAHMTRATFYHHLARIEKILQCDLKSPESRYSLHVALLIRQSLNARYRAADDHSG
ncbi:MAG: PucR family transcriptional regulator [Acidimicrobiales bacterium]